MILILTILLLTMVASNIMDSTGYSYKHRELQKLYTGNLDVIGRVSTIVLSVLSCVLTMLFIDSSLFQLVQITFIMLIIQVLSDITGYNYRELMFTNGGNTKINSFISHSAQALAVMSCVIVPCTYILIQGDFNHNSILLSSYILSSFCILRFVFYNITYNVIQENSIFYESNSSVIGRLTLLLYKVAGAKNKKVIDVVLFLFRLAIISIPFLLITTMTCI